MNIIWTGGPWVGYTGVGLNVRWRGNIFMSFSNTLRIYWNFLDKSNLTRDWLNIYLICERWMYNNMECANGFNLACDVPHIFSLHFILAVGWVGGLGLRLVLGYFRFVSTPIWLTDYASPHRVHPCYKNT